MTHIEKMEMWLDAMETELAVDFMDGGAVGEAAEKLCDAIASLRQAIAEAEKQEPVAWGVDWGKAGDIPCVSIIKRLPNGGIEVVAVEYAPYSYTHPPQRTEPVIDKSAAIRIATALGWEPKRT